MKNSVIMLLAGLLISWTASAINTINSNLSPEEVKGLQQMREEEKLAHDVYSQLYEKWELPVFQNIARSEKRHMEAIGTLLNEFEIEDPNSNVPGKFSNPQIQALYSELMESGNKSLTDALLVGASIEDLDIYDLDNLMSKTDNPRLTTVFENLNKGSRNHLRSFIDLLKDREISYTPNYLSELRFNEIVGTNMERGGRKNGRLAARNNKSNCNNPAGVNCRQGNDKFGQSCRSNVKGNLGKGKRGRY